MQHVFPPLNRFLLTISFLGRTSVFEGPKVQFYDLTLTGSSLSFLSTRLLIIPLAVHQVTW